MPPGALFVEGGTVLRNNSADQVHVSGVRLEEPRDVELIDLYRYSPEGNGRTLVGLFPGSALEYPVLPGADRRHVPQSGTSIEPGEEIALILQLQLVGEHGTFERVIVDYDANGRRYEFRGNIRYEVRAEGCT